MLPPAGPSIAFEICSGAEPMLYVRRSIGDEDVEIARFPLRHNALLEARERFQEAVNKMRRNLHFKLEPEWVEVEAGLSEVYTAGVSSLRILFGGQVVEFMNIMHQLLPAVSENSEITPDVQLVCDKDAVLPMELMPIFRTADPRPPVTDDDSLTETVGRFLGYATNVRRHIRGAPVACLPLCRKGESMISCLPNSAGLKVGVFQEVSLTETAAEKMELQSHGSRLTLLGTWPSSEVGSLDQILAEILRERCPPGEFDAHVLHFACHCSSNVNSPSDVTIRLRGIQMGRIDVTLGKLMERSVVLSLRRPVGAAPNLPLIFLNACSSAAVEPLTGASLPEFFQSEGYAGFIGTEAAVPDAVAAFFSKEFYRCFLSGGSLSGSLRHSRKALLRKYKNPLGLIYVAYADGDICVEYPASEGIS
ncbi:MULTISPECIES: CHAT domain-containing protein [unclassified Streptomyces]|uniref:CHAT domain-containing protein n=1 Tax=unclassified Streptomyces TaxID=2593676 RepID=UPI00381DE7D7